MFTYGIQLWQLSPNSVLHLSLFITLCEAFLGIEPHFGLFKKIFGLRRHGNKFGTYVIGSIGFTVHRDIEYFKFLMSESVQNWRKKWFYLKDEEESFAPFADVLVAKPKKTWANEISAEEEVVVEVLYQKIQKIRMVRNQTSVGTEIVAYFLRNRIQPLMAREHPMFEYVGSEDPTRLDDEDMDDEQLTNEIRRMTRLGKGDRFQLAPLRTPYDAEHPPRYVCSRRFYLSGPFSFLLCNACV